MREDKVKKLYNDLVENQILTSLDIEFAGFILTVSKSDNDILKLLAALVSRQSRNRNLCLDLDNMPEDFGDEVIFETHPEYPTVAEMKKTLSLSICVGNGSSATPLVLEKNRLYLYRHYRYETIIADEMRARSGVSPLCDMDIVSRCANILFTEKGDTDWQKCAAVNAMLRQISVITGGPGTGKTTTVVRIVLIAVYESFKRTGRVPSVALCAPTGKAAAHMKRSVDAALAVLEKAAENNLMLGEILSIARQAFPDSGLTIHRMLKSTGFDNFYYGKKRKLPYDIIIIDECSMADAALFSKLLESVDSNSRVVLLGDSNQLSSVEAGSVLGDICGRAEGSTIYSADYAKNVMRYAGETVPPVMISEDIPFTGVVTNLIKSRRFSALGGIGKLASMICSGKGEEAFEYIKTSSGEGCFYSEIPRVAGADYMRSKKLREVIESAIFSDAALSVSQYRNNADAIKDPDEFLSFVAGFQVLCATRVGPYGSIAANRIIENILHLRGSVYAKGSVYHGMPVIVTENNHALKLYNGDSGIVCESDGVLKAFFQGEKYARGVLPLQISAFEKAYALTVHKSQGSEYDHVVVILPYNDSPALTREMLYTAVTRAKKSVHIVGRRESIINACSRMTVRASGLYEKIRDESR